MKKEIICYKTPEEFLKHVGDVRVATSLYIDSDLGKSIRGENIAKEFFEEWGFRSI